MRALIGTLTVEDLYRKRMDFSEQVAHLESGHYFNPHAQRIIEGKMKGAKLAVMDPRLSNTASMSDYWMPSYPGICLHLCAPMQTTM